MNDNHAGYSTTTNGSRYQAKRAQRTIGIVGTSVALSRLPSFDLDDSLRWSDLVGAGFLAGIGFTVSLLVGELAFAGTGTAVEHVKIGVLLGSFIAAVVGGVLLSGSNRRLSRARRE